jgi:hypothetical protein
MNIERIQEGKALVRDKYIVGIDPGDKTHKAVIISTRPGHIGKNK